MRVGVTGGAGFIGGHVVDELLARGHEAVIFDHHGRGQRDGVEVMLGDTRDETAVVELAAHVEGIIHLASVLGTQETVGNPRPAIMTNVISGLNVMEACVQYGLPAVNIAVGNAGMDNPYSASKTCVESMGRMFAKDRGLAINQVRAVNAYGPRQSTAAPYGSAKVRKIMPAFICRALTGAPIEVYGDGNQVSDMVYVGDVASALINALESAQVGEVFDRVVEVGPAKHDTVNEVARMVALTAYEQHGFELVDVEHTAMRPGETPGAFVVADTATLALVSMTADDLVPLEEGVAHTVGWYVERWLPGFLAAQTKASV